MRETKHVNVRFPPELHMAAVQLAEAQHRSLNGLILVLIEEAIQASRGRVDVVAKREKHPQR